jgi:hypothetical protein
MWIGHPHCPWQSYLVGYFRNTRKKQNLNCNICMVEQVRAGGLGAVQEGTSCGNRCTLSAGQTRVHIIKNERDHAWAGNKCGSSVLPFFYFFTSFAHHTPISCLDRCTRTKTMLVVHTSSMKRP